MQRCATPIVSPRQGFPTQAPSVLVGGGTPAKNESSSIATVKAMGSELDDLAMILGQEGMTRPPDDADCQRWH
jgi:hypothetical protein